MQLSLTLAHRSLSYTQNQRQKARRPRGQTGPPLTRPPQFGPFSNVPSGSRRTNPLESEESSMRPLTSEGGRARRLDPDSPPYNPPLSASSSAGSEYLAHDSDVLGGYGRAPGSSSQLSGPGVPGSSRERPSPFPLRRDYDLPPSAILRHSRHYSEMPSFFHPIPLPARLRPGVHLKCIALHHDHGHYSLQDDP